MNHTASKYDTNPSYSYDAHASTKHILLQHILIQTQQQKKKHQKHGILSKIKSGLTGKIIKANHSRLHQLMTEIVRPEEREILDQIRHIKCPKRPDNCQRCCNINQPVC